MSGWIFDEDITRPTAQQLNEHGVRGVHINYDLHIKKLEDPDVFKEAKRRKKTLLTNDGTQFSRLSDTQLQNSCGIWIVESIDPSEIVQLVKKAIEVTALTSINRRKNKRVSVKKTKTDVYDVETRDVKTYTYRLNKSR